jgi:hypothetical protein
MSLTVTTVKAAESVGPGLKMGVYAVLWDNSYSTGGEPLDMTTDFDYVWGVSIIGNDTLADNGYKIGCIVPAPTVACTTSNVLLDVHWEKNPADGGGADIPFPEFTNAASLAAIGQTMIVVFGA